MSYETIRTAHEHAVRDGAGRRRRRTSPKTRTESVTPTNAPTTGDDSAPPASGRPPLRRWSVAELIARAVAAPTAERMSPC